MGSDTKEQKAKAEILLYFAMYPTCLDFCSGNDLQDPDWLQYQIQAHIGAGDLESSGSKLRKLFSLRCDFAKDRLDLHRQIKVRNEFDILAADPISYLAYNYESASAVLEKNIQLIFQKVLVINIKIYNGSNLYFHSRRSIC